RDHRVRRVDASRDTRRASRRCDRERRDGAGGGERGEPDRECECEREHGRLTDGEDDSHRDYARHPTREASEARFFALRPTLVLRLAGHSPVRSVLHAVRSHLVTFLAFGLTLATASAVADTKRCISAAEQGQQQRKEGKLLAARGSFVACTASECPAVVRKDC